MPTRPHRPPSKNNDDYMIFYTRQGDRTQLAIPSDVNREQWIKKMHKESDWNLTRFCRSRTLEEGSEEYIRQKEAEAKTFQPSGYSDSEEESDCEDMSDSELAQALAPASREPKIPPGWVVHDGELCHLESGFRCTQLPPPDFDPFAHSAPLRPNWIMYQDMDDHNRPLYCHKHGNSAGIRTRPTERDSPPPRRKPTPKAPEPKAPEPKAPEPKAPEPKAPEPVDQVFAVQMEQALQLSIEDAVSTKAPDQAHDRRHNQRTEAEMVASGWAAHKEMVRSVQRERLEKYKAEAAAAKEVADKIAREIEEKEHKQQEKEVEEEADDECVICMNGQVTHVNVPCGHFAYCADCVPKKPDKCPMCRMPLTQVMKVYKRG